MLVAVAVPLVVRTNPLAAVPTYRRGVALNCRSISPSMHFTESFRSPVLIISLMSNSDMVSMAKVNGMLLIYSLTVRVPHVRVRLVSGAVFVSATMPP